MNNNENRKKLTLKKKPSTEKKVNNEELSARIIKRRNFTLDGKPIIEVNPQNIYNKNKSYLNINNIKNQSKKNKKTKVNKPIKKEVKKVIPPTPPKKKKGPIQLLPKIRMPLQEAIKEISKYWPNLFPNEKLRPMEIGLKKKLIKDIIDRELPITKEYLIQCLQSIGNSLEYRETIILGVNRYDKDGNIIGKIDEKSIIYNEEKMKKIKKLKDKLENILRKE